MKHKRNGLSKAWSPYGKGYVSKERQIKAHIDVQGGGPLKPIRPDEVERLATAALVDSDDWNDIE